MVKTAFRFSYVPWRDQLFRDIGIEEAVLDRRG
jgi:hypothetical protein